MDDIVGSATHVVLFKHPGKSKTLVMQFKVGPARGSSAISRTKKSSFRFPLRRDTVTILGLTQKQLTNKRFEIQEVPGMANTYMIDFSQPLLKETDKPTSR
jgi:hypothetical protein